MLKALDGKDVEQIRRLKYEEENISSVLGNDEQLPIFRTVNKQTR